MTTIDIDSQKTSILYSIEKIEIQTRCHHAWSHDMTYIMITALYLP